MKMKKIMLICIFILAILTISVVSASDNATQIEEDSLSVTNINEESVVESDNSQDVVCLDESQSSYGADDSQEIISMNYEEPLGESDGFISMHQKEVAKGNPINFAVLGFDGNMVVKIDGIKKQATYTERADEESWGYAVSTEGLNVGTHVLSIDVSYSQYGHKSKSFTFEIKEIIVDPPTKFTIGGYNYDLYVQLPAGSDFNKLNIYVNGKKATVKSNEQNGVGYQLENLTAPTEGYLNKVVVEYGDMYNKTFNIPTYYTLDVSNKACSQNGGYSGFYYIYPPNDFLQENLVAKIDGKIYPIVKKGFYDSYYIDVSNLGVGEYVVEVSYYEEGRFYNLTEKAIITMVPSMKIDNQVINGKGSIEIDAPGNPITVLAHIYNDYDDYKLSIKTANGKGTFSLAKLNAGTYWVVVTYNGINLEPYGSHSISVLNSKLTAKNLSKYYGTSSPFKVKVNDYKGKIVKSNYVKFYINGKYVKKVKTDKKGYASLKISKAPGIYNISVKYGDVEITRKVTVKHVVTLKTVKVKKSAKSLTLKATLKQGKKALKNKKVTFKFNGKTYKAKTNKKGVAKVTIKKSVLKKLKVGKTVKYQATYLKDTVKKSAKVKR
ncbi:MAG: hypothetical protein IJ104_04730 [Methanobrevibacter sp.]|nr:hypothetical protein [Methanobrevibacter sp.]